MVQTIKKLLSNFFFILWQRLDFNSTSNTLGEHKLWLALIVSLTSLDTKVSWKTVCFKAQSNTRKALPWKPLNKPRWMHCCHKLMSNKRVTYTPQRKMARQSIFIQLHHKCLKTFINPISPDILGMIVINSETLFKTALFISTCLGKGLTTNNNKWTETD